MRSKPVVKIVLLAVLWLAGGLVAEAQIGNLMQRAKKSVSSKTETKVKNLLDGEKAVQEAGLKTMGEMGGGKSYYVSREKGSARAEGTKESPMKDIQKAIDQPYLKGFASLKVMTTESYDPNSAANLYREAHGLNKQGTSTTRVSMFGNRYNFDKAVLLFGAEPGYGAQLPENE